MITSNIKVRFVKDREVVSHVTLSFQVLVSIPDPVLLDRLDVGNCGIALLRHLLQGLATNVFVLEINIIQSLVITS